MRKNLCFTAILGFYGALMTSADAGTVAWFYALDSEKAGLEKITGQPVRTVTSGSCVMHHYRIGRHSLVAAKMGSGCAATAVTAATVLALNSVDRLITTGPAGGLTAEAEIGRWLRITEVVAWQKGKAGANGTGPAPSFKVSFEGGDWPDGQWQRAAPARLASGEAFVASTEARSTMAVSSAAAAVDMNTFGLIEAIEGRSLKMLVLRIVSDRADESASETFARFAKDDNGEGGRIVAEIVMNLPAESNEPSAHDALRELLK